MAKFNRSADKAISKLRKTGEIQSFDLSTLGVDVDGLRNKLNRGIVQPKNKSENKNVTTVVKNIYANGLSSKARDRLHSQKALDILEEIRHSGKYLPQDYTEDLYKLQNIESSEYSIDRSKNVNKYKKLNSMQNFNYKLVSQNSANYSVGYVENFMVSLSNKLSLMSDEELEQFDEDMQQDSTDGNSDNKSNDSNSDSNDNTNNESDDESDNSSNEDSEEVVEKGSGNSNGKVKSGVEDVLKSASKEAATQQDLEEDLKEKSKVEEKKKREQEIESAGFRTKDGLPKDYDPYSRDLDFIKRIKANANKNEVKLNKQIEKILDATSNIISPKFEVINESILEADEINTLSDFEMLAVPGLEALGIIQAMTESYKKIGKCDIYIDFSGSMGGNREGSELFDAKVLTYMLHKKGIIDTVYSYDNKLSPPYEYFDKFLISSSGGGTTMPNVLKKIIKTGRKAIVITDGDMGRYDPKLYTKDAVIINICAGYLDRRDELRESTYFGAMDYCKGGQYFIMDYNSNLIKV